MTGNERIADGINILIQEAYNNSSSHGFWDEYIKILAVLDTTCPGGKYSEKFELDTKLSKIALIVSELGEAVEGVRKFKLDEHCVEFTSEEIEMADAVIRIADYCGAFGLRLAQAILAKMEYNATRPYMHGKGA
jgi:NTP pyrophosphatase (non-canonical NTP hydrolase)